MNGCQSATASLSIESTRWPCLFRILWINHSARTTVVQKVNNNVRVSTFCCAHRVRYGCMLVAVTNPGTWPWMMLPVSGNVRSIGPVLEMMYEPSSSTGYSVLRNNQAYAHLILFRIYYSQHRHKLFWVDIDIDITSTSTEYGPEYIHTYGAHTYGVQTYLQDQRQK